MNIKPYTKEKPKTPLVVRQMKGNEISYKRYVGKNLTNHFFADMELSASDVEEFRIDPFGFMGIDGDDNTPRFA